MWHIVELKGNTQAHYNHHLPGCRIDLHLSSGEEDDKLITVVDSTVGITE